MEQPSMNSSIDNSCNVQETHYNQENHYKGRSTYEDAFNVSLSSLLVTKHWFNSACNRVNSHFSLELLPDVFLYHVVAVVTPLHMETLALPLPELFFEL